MTSPEGPPQQPRRRRGRPVPPAPRGPLPPQIGFVRVPTHSGTWYAILGRDGFEGSLVRRSSEGELEHVCALPEVTSRARYVDRGGHVTGLRYALRWSDGTVATVDDALLHKLETWTGQPLTMKEPRLIAILASAIATAAAQTVPFVDGTPHWAADRLYLPPHGWGPPGYGTGAGDDYAGPRAWREIAALADANPKAALVAGAALGGLYVDPLGREPFTLHLVGDSSEGKTTALTLAAAVLGDVDEVRGSWNKTPVAVLRHLGSLAVLPAVVDELGGGHMSPAQLEAVVFRAASGAEREVATRTGTGTVRTGRWRSVLISSGNRGLSNVTTNPGLIVRALDIAAPVTASAADAELLESLARAGAGWPMRALLEEQALGGDLDRMRHHLAWAEEQLGAGRGGIAGRVARHLALCVAGAFRLGWLVSGRSTALELGEAALEAARSHLDALAGDMDDRGNMGDQLADAVLEARKARPYAYPSDYRADDSDRPLEGIDDNDGTLIVFPGALRRLASEAGIPDPTPGLRDLRRRGVLRSSGHNLTTPQRVGGHLMRVYLFNIQTGTNPPRYAPVTPQVTPLVPGSVTPGTPPDQHFPPPVTPVTPVTPPSADGRDSARTKKPDRMADSDRIETFYRALTRLGLTPTPDLGDARAGLACLEEATGLLYEGPTPARAGLVWIHAVNAHHSIPQLERQDVWLPDRARVAFNLTDPDQADRTGALVQLDVNSAYANAAQSVELGTGAPVRIQSPTAADLKHPGFVTIPHPDPGWPAPFGLLEAGRPVYTGTAALLADWIGTDLELGEAWTWPDHRRWLRPFARRMLVARAHLDTQDSHPARLAVAVLKRIYSAALGGMLASTTHNRTAYLRPDWALLIRAHTHANLWRQLHHATPPPVAVATDSASFIVPAGELPAGLTISTQPGKLKVERRAELSDRIRQAIRAGQPRKVQLLALEANR